jgi:hypothetical protein
LASDSCCQTSCAADNMLGCLDQAAPSLYCESRSPDGKEFGDMNHNHIQAFERERRSALPPSRTVDSPKRKMTTRVPLVEIRSKSCPFEVRWFICKTSYAVVRSDIVGGQAYKMAPYCPHAATMATADHLTSNLRVLPPRSACRPDLKLQQDRNEEGDSSARRTH